MHDYPGDSAGFDNKIRKLQGRLNRATNEFTRKSLVEELGRLEQERLHGDNIFAADAEEQEDTEHENLPILVDLRERYENFLKRYTRQLREIRDLLLYLHHFDAEFLGLLSERKLRLDVKFSVERDGFYNSFNRLSRQAESYCEEAERIQDGAYAKAHEEDILKRMVEMRHNLFIEANRFFRRVQSFSRNLLDDLAGDAIMCQNGDERLEYSEIDHETELRGKTVQEGLDHLNVFSKEVVAFLNVPDFG